MLPKTCSSFELPVTVRNVLVIAYYFPPMGLSGVQRVAKLVKYLPAAGWQPTVLTVDGGGYFAFDPSLLAEIEAAGVAVHRSRTVDPTRVFARRRTVSLPKEEKRRRLAYLSQLLFVPDNKIGWYPWAVREGRRLLQSQKFDLILSSAPPYTGHLVGAALSRRTGVPLVVDYRDDWLENPRHVYPTPLHRRLNQALERRVFRTASCVTAINEPIRQALESRTQGLAAAPPCRLLPQGFDPADFAVAPVEQAEGRMRLVYSGVFYDAQTPDPFLEALARLVACRPEVGDRIEARFVGLMPAGAEALIERLGIGALVSTTGYVPHAEAVANLKAADVLWLTVGERPGAAMISTSKLYEYMGARKPILGLVPEGAARNALAPYGAARLVPPTDIPAITQALSELWDAWKANRLPKPDASYVSQFDRARLAAEAARLFDSVIAK